MHGNDAKELCRAMDEKAVLAILHTTDEKEFVKSNHILHNFRSKYSYNFHKKNKNKI